MSKTDKRYLRTEQAFHIAVMNLLAKQEKLTVTSLSEETHVHRKTFYLHYNAVEDVVNEVTERLMELLRTCLDASANEQGCIVSDTFFQSLLFKIIDRKPQFEAFTQKNVPSYFFALLEQPLCEELEKRMSTNTVLPAPRLHYAVVQLVAGVLRAFAMWTEKKEIPVLELFELLSKVTRAQTEVIYGKKVR